MTSPFPELRVLALVEGVEAIGTNLENAVTFEIGSIVGNEDISDEAFALNLECDIELGDNVFADAIERVMNALCNGFRAITSRLFEIAEAFARTIQQFMDRLLNTIIDTVTDIISRVTQVLSDAVVSVVAKLEEAVAAIVNTLTDIVGAIADQVRRIVESLQDIVSAIFDRIATVVNAIINKLSDGVSAVLAAIGSVLTGLRDGIASIVGSLVDAVFVVVTRIGDSISTLIDTLVGTAEAGLGRIRSVIEDIPSTLREVAESAQEFIGERIGNPLANIGSLFVEQVEAFFARLIDDDNVSPDTIISEFLTGVGMPAEEVERFASSAKRAMPNTPVWLAAAMAFVIPMLLSATISTIAGPVLENLRQETAKRVTPTLIPPADSINAFIRGFMTEADFRNELGEAGFSNEKMDILLVTSQRLIDLGELFRWWLRGIITDEQLDNALRDHRIESADRERLKQAVFFIPPVQDLIRMAVREVFAPDVRERFQLDQDFPAAFAEAAKQQAVSDEWARNYWAAHWVLPSVTQGFTMLHRKVIDTDDLDLLLRAQDVMPFWRERITKVAFNPLTRVDLRRMAKLGLLDEEELQARYEALGFDADNAGLMVEFTKAFNDDGATEDEVELAGLTRGTILSMFDDGILTEDDTKDALLGLGISENAASLFIMQRTLETERRNRTSLVENIVRLAGGGHIDLGAAQDGLAGLGLTATEIALAVQRILRNRDSRDRLPTLAQLNKMRTQNIVTDDQWEEAMGGLGFSDVWIERLGKLTGEDA